MYVCFLVTAGTYTEARDSVWEMSWGCLGKA